MANFITIDNNQYDLNGIMKFDFNFNFELLKNTLEALVNAQNLQNRKILELEQLVGILCLKEIDPTIKLKKDKVKNEGKLIPKECSPKKLINLKKKIPKQITYGKNDFTENNEIVKESIKEGIEKKASNEVEENEGNKDSKVINESVIIDEINKSDDDYDDIEINNNKEKVYLNNFDYINCGEDLKEEIKKIKAKIHEIESSIPKINIEEKLNSIDKQLGINNDILEDFNIFDIVNNNTTTPESISNNEKIVEIIQSQEKKKHRKFEIIDEKIKKLEDELYKIKHEKMGFKINEDEKHHQLIYKLEEDIKKLNNTDEEIKKSFGEYIEKILKEIEEKHEINQPIFQRRRSSNNGSILVHVKELNEENKPDNIVQKINEPEYKYFRELNKKMNELERSFRLLTKEMNHDIVMDKISHIESHLNKKVENTELLELRESFNKSLVHINYMKESVSQLIEDRQMQDDYNLIRKKVENLVSTINGIKIDEISSHRSLIESNHYIDRLFFNDFQQNLNKEIEALKESIYKEIKNANSDLSSEIKQCIKEKDLKLLEEYVNNKHEEARIQSMKKFADKNETSKNVKYLDTQIKQIIDVYIKKSEKGDSWIIAKKPLGGYSCASCERYLGDLQENQEYLPWNKVSKIASEQRLYRIGNGFSRMLNMLNENMTKDEDSVSRNSISSLKNLPRIKSNRTKANVSFDNDNPLKDLCIEKDGMGGYIKTEIDNGSSAKIVKIYRKKIKVLEKNKNKSEII